MTQRCFIDIFFGKENYKIRLYFKIFKIYDNSDNISIVIVSTVYSNKKTKCIGN